MKKQGIGIVILLLVISNFSCLNLNSKMIDIEFADEKPEFYGFTGVHLYESNSKIINGEKKIFLDEKTNAVDLYKLYQDIIIFLSNQVEPFPDEKNVKTYPVFGNPKHMKFIKKLTNGNREYQIVGFLDVTDVEKVNSFLNSNGLDKKENVQEYFDTLDNEVKAELEILLDDRIVWELHGYLESLVKFFKECANNKNEVVIISNA